VNSITDLGGMHGAGPIIAPANEPVFQEDWERRLFGLVLATLGGGHFTLDEARHATERMPPARYLNSSYYQQWLFLFETVLVEKGVVTMGEVEAHEAKILAGAA
jgi:nitrile hydratase